MINDEYDMVILRIRLKVFFCVDGVFAKYIKNFILDCG